MLVPEHILLYFEILGAKEQENRWVIDMREKEGFIPTELLEYEDVLFDGYCNPIKALSHSFVCKPVYLRLYRRRYKRSNSDKHFSNDYDVTLKGVSIVPEMVFLLKKRIEFQPVNISVVAHMFGLPAESLQYWYKNFLSSYLPDIENNTWTPQKIDTVNNTTGEIHEKPVYIFKEENLGENMSIDDKAIGNDGFTILSNPDTGKIAMIVESTNSEEVGRAMKLFGDKLACVKNISMDMSATYALY